MSLRSFHLFFIALSALFTLGFAAWLAGLAGAEGNPSLYVAALGCVFCAATMVVYAVRFFRKTRNMVPSGSL